MWETIKLGVCIFTLTILLVDFWYTLVFWLIKGRPHLAIRYFGLAALLGLEATGIVLLLRYIVRVF